MDLTTKEAATIYGVHRMTIESWCKKGWIKTIESEGVRKFDSSDVEAVVEMLQHKKSHCRACDEPLSCDNRYSSQNICKKCYAEMHKAISRRRREDDPKKMSEHVRQSNAKTKELVFMHYGNGKIACQNCGFDDIRALSIDHLNGGGRQHRKQIGGGGQKTYNWLKKNNYPAGYQILCMNCQFIKRHTNSENN